MTCEHPGCPTALKPRATPGRPVRFCNTHQGGKYAKQRQRLRDAQGREQRPSCCADAGRLGGRLQCPQHEEFASVGGFQDTRRDRAWREYAASSRPGFWRIATDDRAPHGQWMTEPYRVIGSGDAKAWQAANPGWDKRGALELEDVAA